MHPVERLRYVARATGYPQSVIVSETARALASFASDPQGLVTACRRMVQRQPGSAPLVWLCARVLCAGDPYAEIRAALEELEDEGVELHVATNGEEALAAIQALQPNLVFLDVMMPKLSGFDVCERTKKLLGLSHVYIVLLTAKGQEFDRQRGVEVGADLYMTKPFDPDALLMKARDVLGI